MEELEENVFNVFLAALPVFFRRDLRSIMDDVSERSLFGTESPAPASPGKRQNS